MHDCINTKMKRLTSQAREDVVDLQRSVVTIGAIGTVSVCVCACKAVRACVRVRARVNVRVLICTRAYAHFLHGRARVCTRARVRTRGYIGVAKPCCGQELGCRQSPSKPQSCCQGHPL